MRRIPNSTTSAVIKELSMIFSEYDRPYLFRSDNGPCYASQEFKFYTSEMKIKHRTSSPHYPQSNGLAESMVKISKSLIEKVIRNSKPWNFYLEEQKSTPISSSIPSPTEILFGRKMRSNLSILPSQLMNDRIVSIQEQIPRKESRILTEERNSTSELNLEPSQSVWHQDPVSKKWNSGWVKEPAAEPNSFYIETEEGVTYRRNRNFKPRQVPQVDATENDYSNNLGWSGNNPNSLQSGNSTPTEGSSVPPTEVPSPAKKTNSTPVKSETPRHSTRSTKGILPTRLIEEKE